MKKGSLLKYKIGLAVIMLFVIVMLVIVINQANATKQDTNTYNTATNVADTLNSYIDTNNMIPTSLEVAGVNNPPSSISYQKLSSSSYKFCVDYKTVSSGFDASAVESSLISDAVGSGNAPNDSGVGNDYLVISNTHNKGQNCQTITPIIYNPDYNNSFTTPSID